MFREAVTAMFYQVSNFTGAEPSPPFFVNIPLTFHNIVIHELFEDGNTAAVLLEDPDSGESCNHLDADAMFLSSRGLPITDSNHGEIVQVSLSGTFSTDHLSVHIDGSESGELIEILSTFIAQINSPMLDEPALIVAVSTKGHGYAVGSFSLILTGEEDMTVSQRSTFSRPSVRLRK